MQVASKYLLVERARNHQKQVQAMARTIEEKSFRSSSRTMWEKFWNSLKECDICRHNIFSGGKIITLASLLSSKIPNKKYLIDRGESLSNPEDKS